MLLLLLVGGLPQTTLALDPAHPLTHYPSRVWRTAQGMPHDTVIRLLQTRDGYLWLATEEGLTRFDGVRFTVFDTRRRPEMNSNLIYGLAEDGRGRLWFGTAGGLGCLDGDVIRSWTVADGLPNGTVSNLVWDERENCLWVGTRKGLARFGLDDERFQVYPQVAGLGDAPVWAMLRDRGGRLWVGSSGGLHVRETDGRFRLFTKENGLPHRIAQSLAEDSAGGIWVGTPEGLARQRGDDRFEFVPTTEDGRGEIINALWGDRQGCLWIGGRPAVRRLRVADGRLEHLPAESRGPGLSVQGFCEDAEGNVWIGTAGDGALMQLRDSRFANVTPRDGLDAGYVNSLVADGAGTVWIGTARGLHRHRDGVLTRVEIPPKWRAGIGGMCLDPKDNSLWFTTGRKGLGRLTGAGIEWFDQDPQDINCVWLDAGGTLWAGLPEGIRQLRDGRFIPPGGPMAALVNLQVKTTLTDRAGNLWLGTRTEGLYRLTPAGEVRRWASTGTQVIDQVMVLREDAENGCLWIGTLGGGLLRLKDGELRACTEREGLFDRNVFWLEEDAAGDFWMTCNRGLYRVSKRQLNDWAEGRRARVDCVVYDASDGLCSGEGNGGNMPSGCRSADGRLWFATPKGAVVVGTGSPAAPGVNAAALNVGVEEIVTNGRETRSLRGQPMSDALVLPPGTEKLEFRYTALTFTAPERVTFRCRLEPTDQGWVEAETRRAAYYTGLAPGSYRFRVQARRPDGGWNEQASTALAVELRPFFYQTRWFLAACVGAGLAAAGLAGWWLHRLKLARVRARLQERHACVLAERERIAREIHDTLTQGFVGIRSQLQAATMALPENGAVPDEARRHLALAQRMAQHSVTEARRSMGELRSDDIDARDLPTTLLEEAETLGANAPAAPAVEVRVEGAARRLPDAAEHGLRRIAQEALTNALKHAGARRVQVTLVYGEGETRLEVGDDGRGFDTRGAFSTLDGHFGLLGMRERAEALGGRLQLQSEPGAGTRMVVTLPDRAGVTANHKNGVAR